MLNKRMNKKNHIGICEFSSSQKGSLYDNNNYHEECLRCNSCGINLTGPNQKRARRYKNHFLCDLHFADVALMETSDFLHQLRSFKPQSLGCAVARRKSSTTLIFPLPPQACAEEFCSGYPHNLIPTPGYWMECSGHALLDDTIWDETEPESCDYDVVPCHSDQSDHVDQNVQVYPGGQVPVINEPTRQKTSIQEQWERNGQFELTSIEQETYERYFYGSEHWNYFTQDDDLGPVILSLKQETTNGRDQFRIMVRGISYTVHGMVPASCVFADRYNREEVVRSFSREINLNPPLTLGQLPDIPEELLKLDQVFIKSELKVGVVYVKEGQYTEEEILDNNESSVLFDEFIQILGDKIRLKGFDKYKGGLDTVHDLTGLYSIYTHWRSIEIMFHVSMLLPYEKHDPQKLQRKRHLGNDIVCVVFLEADNTHFSPACIKSHFLHTFIIVRTSPRIKFKPTRYETTVSTSTFRKRASRDQHILHCAENQGMTELDVAIRHTRYNRTDRSAGAQDAVEVAVVSRDEVGAYKPYLWEQGSFEKGPMFREWLLTKIVNGERASYSAPKFARMQDRTRSQMLEDLVNNLQNHAETGQIPKPYRRGSWRPIGHMRPSSPLLDSVRDLFEGHDQLAKDFTKAFHSRENSFKNMLYDITFWVGAGKEKTKLMGVRAILGVRSRVFQEMLYGFSTGFGSPQVSVADILARAVPTLHSPTHKSKSSNFLQVPDIETPRPKSVPNSPMVMRAFSRLGTLTSGWGRSSKKHERLSVEDKKKWASSQDCSEKDGKEKNSSSKDSSLAVPRLSVCADVGKVDRARLCQTEVRVTPAVNMEPRQNTFSIIEFEAETLRILLDYLHTGSCPLTCTTIPGLICAAEHYDLPELLQACFHHAKQFLRIEVVCNMLSSLENYYWRYTSASELVNMILAFVETRAVQVFQTEDFLSLSESMVQMMMARNLEVAEITKFEAMLTWARFRVRSRGSNKVNSRTEFRAIMERLTRELKLYRISPQDLIKTVLPSKAIKNERILETLMYQANSGMYRIHDSYLQACTRDLHKQESKFSDWESFDYGL
ncbi:BTB/Kelch-associated [Trinorchestia longiramus]|nr:BTB/Kelch-associated [Trinorchestia longiramus]